MQIQGGICIILIMACVGNLHKDQRVTLDLFIMAQVGNLNKYLGGYFSLFFNGRCGNLLEKIIDPMVIIIRAVGLMAECF